MAGKMFNQARQRQWCAGLSGYIMIMLEVRQNKFVAVQESLSLPCMGPMLSCPSSASLTALQGSTLNNI